MRVQAFIAQPTIEAVNKGIVGGLSRPAEVQRDAVDVGPVVECPRDKSRAIVHPDLGGWSAAFEQQAIHDIDHLFTLDPLIDVDHQTLAGVSVHDGQSADRLPLNRVSDTKSIAQISFVCEGSGRSTRRAAMTCRRGRFARKFRLFKR